MRVLFLSSGSCFFDAQSMVVPALSAYMKDVPVESGYFEFEDFSKKRDFCLMLCMPDDFIRVVTDAVDSKIRQFLIAYIMYRWLETKLPEEAQIYLERATFVLGEAKELLERRSGRLRICDRLF